MALKGSKHKMRVSKHGIRTYYSDLSVSVTVDEIEYDLS
jgi:hypothetical protein